MDNIAIFDYNGQIISRRHDGFVNLTQMCQVNGKRLDNWMRLKQTQDYITVLGNSLTSEVVYSEEGVNGGTWGHPSLAINLARWISSEFAVWCVDELIGVRYKSFGSVEGVLNAIDLSQKPLFRIYDLLTGKDVKCHFMPGLIEEIKDALGKRVSVYGLIRSREDGQKVSVEVEDMEVFPDETELPSIKDIIGISLVIFLP